METKKEIPKAPYHYSEGPAFKRFCRHLAEQIVEAWQSGQLYRGEDGEIHWRDDEKENKNENKSRY